VISSSGELVLDTDVILAGVRSPTGASAELLRMARRGELTLLISVPLFIEYDAKCLEQEHRDAAGLTVADAQLFLDALTVIAKPVAIHFTWRPQLTDPADEMVLETAINGQANALATFNRRDFGKAPEAFGIELLLTSEALRRLR
jgi:putative PIN family toxin of toxin-antitoxin system